MLWVVLWACGSSLCDWPAVHSDVLIEDTSALERFGLLPDGPAGLAVSDSVRHNTGLPSRKELQAGAPVVLARWNAL